MFNRSRALLASALAILVSPIAAAVRMLPSVPEAVAAPTRQRCKSAPGLGRKGYRHPVTGKRVFARPAVKFIASPNNGMHWEHGRLVEPDRIRYLTGDARLDTPVTRKEQRAVAAALARQQPLSARAEARAARRRGEISPRQQRKQARIDRRLNAPDHYGLDAFDALDQIHPTGRQSFLSDAQDCGEAAK